MCVNDVVPPTVFLPPLKLLKPCSQKEISHALASLRRIYLPEVRGSSRRRDAPRPTADDPAAATHTPLTHHIRETTNGNDLSAIRADPFERTFAIQWLTRFVSLFSDAVADSVSSQALEDAASLLAICAGSAASGTVIRTFIFPLSSEARVTSPELVSTAHEAEEPSGVSVILRDVPLESSDFSSVGAQTWGGSCILAEMIAENPQNFSIYPRKNVELCPTRLHTNDAPFRALELGAGTGLASLVLGKVLSRIRGVHRHCQGRSSSMRPDSAVVPIVDTVIATDFHLSVLDNLRSNFAVNFPPGLSDSEMHTDHGVQRSSFDTADVRAPNMVVLPLDWSVIHSLVDPGPSGSQSSNLQDTLTNEMSILRDDTPTALRHKFQLETQTNHMSDQTEIISGPQQSPDDTIPCPIPSQLEITPFDLIIGADIIYEHLHARWVRSCVERFLRKPTRPPSQADHIAIRSPVATVPAPGTSSSSEPLPLLTNQHPSTALFHLVIPLRHTHAVECRSVEEVFLQARDIVLARQRATVPPQRRPSSILDKAGGTSISCDSDDVPMLSSADNFIDPAPLELAIINQEDIWCDAYRGREEGEVVYRYYRIGWV